MAHDVLISYSSKDKLSADAICARLEEANLRCWIAPRDVPLGKAYAESIIKAIEGTRVMVLVFSGNANESQHVKLEVERAASKGVTIIPVRIENSEMSDSLEYFVSSMHWLDALTPPLEEHIDKLARDLKVLLAQSSDDNVEISRTFDTAAPPTPAVSPPAKEPTQSKSSWATRLKSPVGIGCGAVIALGLVGVIWLASLPTAGVKLANEMEQYAIDYLEEHAILEPGEEVLAYYDVTIGMDGTEAAILTTRRVLYHKDSRTTGIEVADISDIRSRDDGINGRQIQVESDTGEALNIGIAIGNRGETFDDLLRSAWKRARGDRGGESSAETDD